MSTFVAKAPTIPAQISEVQRPRLAFPHNSCDAHVHVFGPQDRYPHGPTPGYIPNLATVEQLRAMLHTIGCARAVIVQPSYYGADNSCTVDALIAGQGSFRGVACVTADVSDAELDALHAAGVRGARVNVKAANGVPDMTVVNGVAERIKRLGWHVQLFFHGDTMPTLDESLAKLPVDVVIDHIGYVRATDGVHGKGFQMLMRLARSGRVWFKLSAPYRQSDKAPHFEDVAPLAHALYAAAPDRCVWASDWPHASRNDTGIIRVPNDGELADAFINYFPDAADRQRILVDNPARLYGFE
jgi:2-pyrone-4,6-dicarboxylate lactonase